VTVAPAPGHGGRPHVRPATAEDLPALVQLWEQFRASSGGRQARDLLQSPTEDPESKFVAILGDPDRRLVVATVEDLVEGLAVMSVSTLGPLSAARAVQLAHVVVEGGRRRRGIGQALVAAAAAYADEVGADQVVVSVYPNLREANRFYARLGFTPLVVRRVATVAALRRRLATAEHPVASVDELARKRIVSPRLRTVRRRNATPR
jgi:ribosomal protein S18 acetylase RimI-like enzyme